MGFCLCSSGSLYLPVCLSHLGATGFSCDLTSFMVLRGIVAFSVFPAFYLSGQSGDFQASYIPDGNHSSW